jgi:hypothetical protein
MIGMRKSNGNGTDRAPPPLASIDPPPITYAPKPRPGPHQLGNITLKNVDQLTAMSADEIEKVADQLVEAAHETADLLRGAAGRMREIGVLANERLAHFVTVATACGDAARTMLQAVAHRDDPPPPPPPLERTYIEPTDLDTAATEGASNARTHS